MSPILKSTLSWVVTLLIPLTILMLGARLLLAPAFLEVEYRMPGFPADDYGFTLEDRIRWGTPSLIYLINDQGIGFLAELMFDNGIPIYNARELSHMKDVKDVLQVLLKVWYVALGILIVLGIWARRAHWLDAYNAGWRRGGFLMVGLLVAFGIFAVTSFWDFFTWFHSLFFKGNTWQFYFSDTLIRLFPMRFWADCFIYIGAFSLIVALILIFGLKPKAGQ
jgi:integral membrane protein (TIGR01906 family)